MKHFEISGIRESVVERADYPPERLRAILDRETVAVLGYGVQGRGQSLNLRDGGVKVVVGLRPTSPGWAVAESDGWKPGETLVPIEDAVQAGSLVLYLLSDAGQKEQWRRISPLLVAGQALVFAHGFSIVFSDQTGVVPPPGIDVALVAPKGSGTTLRRNFVEGLGLNASIAIHQDATGRARERADAIGFAIGAAYLFETTFEKEVYADLTGERGVLLGAIYGLWLAQYEVMRAHGHSPIESFNECVEEATQSLYPLIGENGMDWMYSNCSTTAQRGALDWFKVFRDAVKPVFENLYSKVADGSETRRTLESNGRSDYQQSLQAELDEIARSEMWRAGKVVRELRPRHP